MVEIIGSKRDCVFDAKGAFNVASRDRYWAERGLVHVENCDGANYSSMTVPDAVKRAAAFSGAIKAARQAGSWSEAQVESMVTTLERFIDVIQQARAQGDVTDPKVVAARAKLYHKLTLAGPVPRNF